MEREKDRMNCVVSDGNQRNECKLMVFNVCVPVRVYNIYIYIEVYMNMY